MRTFHVVLAALSLVACNRLPDSDATDDAADTDTEADVSHDDSTSDDTTVDDTDVSTDDTDGGGSACGIPDTLDPWDDQGQLPHPLDGATIVTGTLLTDAGLDDLNAAMPARGLTATGSWQVEGAVVITLGFPQDKSIWLEDANGATRLFVSTALAPAPSPGDVVSFTATELHNYDGETEVTVVTDWAVSSSGSSIPVTNVQTVAVTETHAQRNVSFYGEVTGTNGACGTGTTCWIVTHDGVETEVRVRDLKNVKLRDCLQVIAPVSHFERDAVDTYRIDLQNLDWARYY